jgi:ADP-ribose pyrophosphatase YjhB (NUDIX family)
MGNNMSNKDQYFVTVKVFLVNDGKLLITKDRFDCWDIPGGRLRPEDFDVELENVVTRKMIEELGDNVKYELGQPVIFMRHERDEILPSGEKEKKRIFAVGYEAKYLGGEIILGPSHEKYEWVDIDNFEPDKYFVGGWLKGVSDYIVYYKKQHRK